MTARSLFVTTAMGLLAFGSAKAAPTHPNILLIYVDDLGYEGLNCYGGMDFSTPNLDQMAKEGIRFPRAYASGVCTPSRVSMHTGLYGNRHTHTQVLPVHKGTKEVVDFVKMPTFAQTLQAAGYQTAVTGKWQLATLEEHQEHPRTAGFDSWCLWQIWKTNPSTGEGEKTLRYWNPSFNMDGVLRNDISERFGPDVLVEYVIEKMKKATAAGEPFLIVHNEMLPHFPMVQTPDDRAANPQRPAKLDNMVQYMDKLVKQLLDAVDQLGIRDNTYVVFMADNGTEEHYFKNPRAGEANEQAHTRHTKAGKVNGGKYTVVDAGTHVPLIVWGPKAVPKGAICDDLVDVVDLFPTFCEMAGKDVPKSAKLDGLSIVPLIHGQPGPSHDFVYGSVKHRFAVFDGKWRLKHTGELLDARNLPIERPAIDTDPAAQAAMIRLKKAMKSINDKKAPMP